MNNEEMLKKWRRMNASINFGNDDGIRKITVNHKVFSSTRSLEELTDEAYEWWESQDENTPCRPGGPLK